MPPLPRCRPPPGRSSASPTPAPPLCPHSRGRAGAFVFVARIKPFPRDPHLATTLGRGESPLSNSSIPNRRDSVVVLFRRGTRDREHARVIITFSRQRRPSACQGRGRRGRRGRLPDSQSELHYRAASIRHEARKRGCLPHGSLMAACRRRGVSASTSRRSQG